jgi:glycosyltransferase involved in cell wall biosynthesis
MNGDLGFSADMQAMGASSPAVSEPSVAIITRTQCRPLTLDRAIRSVLAQRFQDWELIVVSDAGNLPVINQVLGRYADALAGRCRLLHRDVSCGMEAASNFGVSHSRSRYVVLHDDDDSWHPDFLWATVGFLEASGTRYHGVIAGTELIFEHIHEDRIQELRRCHMRLPPPELGTASLRQRNCFPPIAFVYDREAWRATGGYRESLRALGDWDFNVRFASHFKIGQIPDVLAYWHHRPKARRRLKAYANSPYRDHMECLMRLKEEWGERRPLWRYLLWWRY